LGGDGGGDGGAIKRSHKLLWKCSVIAAMSEPRYEC
jgi:hypothetical protein